jgi:hypothetical protein
MKTLIDGYEVSARSYYYLLDWNEKNEWRFIVDTFGKNKLSELNRVEYKRLFNKATTDELNKMI